jgi:hypothetical protein
LSTEISSQAAFSRDGARILTGSADKTAKLWDATSGKLIGSFDHQDGVTDALFSPDGARILTASADNTVAVNEAIGGLGAKPPFECALSRVVLQHRKSPNDLSGERRQVAEWVDNALLTNPNVAEQWLRNALVFLPDHPLLHLALAGLETDSKRADFLCSFGLARLPKDSVFCMRASEMLLAQHRPELALAAIEKALVAKSDGLARPAPQNQSSGRDAQMIRSTNG